jgi:hypothetical protein
MNIGTRYKVTKNAWFLYATKDMAMEQTGPYGWFACSNNTNPEYVFGWADYWSKKYNCEIVSCMFPNNTFIILDEDERDNGDWKDGFKKIETTTGEVGWMILPHSQNKSFCESDFEVVTP